MMEMPFESLSYRYVHTIPNFPPEWVPLIHLYDPDLPLFPLYYFHALPNGFPPEERPDLADRAYGYVEKINQKGTGLETTIVCNKDLTEASNSAFISPVLFEVEERFGFRNPVRLADVSNAFSGPFAHANHVLIEIWRRVVPWVYGNLLPFGRLCDPVHGLARYVASWNPPAGRKSELIQTYYFCSRFGEKIQFAGGIRPLDFHLLPTFEELSNPNNPLTLFPKFQALCDAAQDFHRTFCTVQNIGGGLSFSKFNLGAGSTKLNTSVILNCIHSLGSHHRTPLLECFNAFDKGPQRTVIYLLMLNDLRSRRLVPQRLISPQCGLIYDNLWGFYQSPKAIEIYAQQCFGNPSAMPLDTWVETFMKWPLAVHPGSKGSWQDVFAHANNLGRIERLLWTAAQARKVHSSACNDALWCAKIQSLGEPRGANPLSCKACLPSIRNACSAYAQISNGVVSFNDPRGSGMFEIHTSAGNNTTPNQHFVKCEGRSIYHDTYDDFTPVDVPGAFAPYPRPGHRGNPLTVEEFVNTY